MKKIVFILSLIICFLVFIIYKDGEYLTYSNKNIIKELSNKKIKIKKILNVEGLFDWKYIETDINQKFYYNPKKNYLIFGNIIDLSKNTNITAQIQKSENINIYISNGKILLVDPNKIPSSHIDNIEKTIKHLQFQRDLMLIKQ